MQRWLVLVVCGLVARSGYGTADGFYLRDGDTVLFHGDSITEGRLYNGFVETFVTTRFPKWNIRFVHHGWGGDKVTGGPGGPIDVRLKRDVIAWKPNVVAIMLGMNDGGYRAADPQIHATYTTGLAHIVQTLKASLDGVRITGMRPSPYDEVTRGLVYPHSYNDVLIRFGDFVSELGAKQKFLVVDMNAPVVEVLKKAKAIDAEASGGLIGDHVHPELAIHFVMAAELLKGWKAPAVVSAVEIDAERGTVRSAENTQVSELAVKPTVSWTQLDGAIPMPVDRENAQFALVLKAYDFDGALNRQMLRVLGLRPGRYELKIDGEEVAVVGAEELAAGINVARLNTPMIRQAAQSHEFMVKHNKVHYFRWRLPVPLEGDDWPQLTAALKAMDELEGEYMRRQREAAQPRAHRFEVIPRS